MMLPILEKPSSVVGSAMFRRQLFDDVDPQVEREVFALRTS
jgi:hypothetical protein